MVVDDDLNHLALVSHILEPIGFSVVVAGTAELALDMLKDITPDLFVLDIDMPGQDGWSLAKQLRNSELIGVPIIMISGHAKDAEAPTPQLSLYDAFISKPYNLDDLVVRLSELLKIELDLSQTPPQSKAKQSPLSQSDVNALIRLAQTGQASGLRDRLQTLSEAASCPTPLLATLKMQLAAFDLAGMVRTLEQEVIYDDA